MDKTTIRRANKQQSCSRGDNDGPTQEHSCNESLDASNSRSNGKHLHDVAKKKPVKRSQKRLSFPVKKITVKQTAKTVDQTKIRSHIDKQGSKCCSPVLTFLASLSAGAPSGRCHPEAQLYKRNFKMKKEELCEKLFSLYNDKLFNNKLPHYMRVEWNNRLKRAAGVCHNCWITTSSGTKIRSSQLEISTKVCDRAERLRDILIHEMCHAAVWIFSGLRNGHGELWKAWVRKAAHVFPELPPIKPFSNYSIQTKFTYRCTRCGYSFGRDSKSQDVLARRCRHCFGAFELLANRRRKSGTIVQTPVKFRSPVGFARFVKENYHAVRDSRIKITHADVMQLLGQQFSAMKIVPGTSKQ